ncbi:MAG TPA: hypothetical protein ENI80_03745 [Acidiferrobacteraceae bacterium]|nr:hypothetical protein [Acidiferrobacteraceae bacterium]
MGEISNIDESEVCWDLALAGLAEEEHRKLGRTLKVEDFSRIAKENAMRLDDIMSTMFELCLRGHWFYQGTDGVNEQITRDMIDKLNQDGRLNELDLAAYSGGWRPS